MENRKYYTNAVERLYNYSLKNMVGLTGGQVRAKKGKLVEDIARLIVFVALEELGIDNERISIESRCFSDFPIQNLGYLSGIPNSVTVEVIKSVTDCIYKLETDLHVRVDGNLLLNIECKSYCEAAMLKRVLVDSMFLSKIYPGIKTVMLQLENALGENIEDNHVDPVYRSHSAHVIFSAFPEVKLVPITLLDGHRSSSKPIHFPEFYKPINRDRFNKAIDIVKSLIKRQLRKKIFVQQIVPYIRKKEGNSTPKLFVN